MIKNKMTREHIEKILNDQRMIRSVSYNSELIGTIEPSVDNNFTYDQIYCYPEVIHQQELPYIAFTRAGEFIMKFPAFRDGVTISYF